MVAAFVQAPTAIGLWAVTVLLHVASAVPTPLVLLLLHTMDDTDTEKMRNYDWQMVVLSDQDNYIRSLLSHTLPRGYLKSLGTSFKCGGFAVAWKRQEAHHGQSNAPGMAALVAEFDKALDMDISYVGQLIVRVKETCNRIYRQSRENLNGVTMIPSHEGFHLDKVEALLRNVFMDKSKNQIQVMQARIVSANYKADYPKMKKDRSIGLVRTSIFVKGKRVEVPPKSVGGSHVQREKKGSKKKAKSMREEIPAAVVLMQPISKVEVAAMVKGTPQEPGPGYSATLTSEQAEQDVDELMTSPPSSPTTSSSSSVMSKDENDMDECEQGYFPSHSVKLSEASSKIKQVSMDIESAIPTEATA
ncbi:hypothetical protein PHMEG_00011701 [Phytophthora megakarya]|uniref:Uncharacterized protein n=1 Tax=Phytophthora megakarya TaxID=4795 RepID=A0A225WB38_9STRA|nr:hypothetical protein PHMEG_00011701 [Phytophthora megakarya]